MHKADNKAKGTRRERAPKRANDLNGKEWLSYSLSVWSDIRKTQQEASLKHPAMFPAMLAERLIRCFTTADQTVVLDPFLGSGSTLVAAVRLGKSGIGVELNADYVRLAQNRLAQRTLWSAGSRDYRIYQGDAARLLRFVHPNTVDITVTSPPYWDILNQPRTADYKRRRNYGNLRGDLSAIGSYRVFLDALRHVFEAVHVAMRPERYCIVIVMDLRKKNRFFPYHCDVSVMMQQIGFILDDLIIWDRRSEYNNLRPLGYPAVFRINKVHEFCLVFKTAGKLEKRRIDDRLLDSS